MERQTQHIEGLVDSFFSGQGQNTFIRLNSFLRRVYRFSTAPISPIILEFKLTNIEDSNNERKQKMGDGQVSIRLKHGTEM